MTEAITVIVIGLLWTLIAFLFEKQNWFCALPAYVETIDKQHVLYYWMITLICMGSAYFVCENILPLPALYVCALFNGSEVLAIFCLSTISVIVRYCILWLPHVHIISSIFEKVPDINILRTIFQRVFYNSVILVAGSVYVQTTFVICCILVITAITMNRYLTPIVRDLKTLHADVRVTIANATECSRDMRYLVDQSKDTSFYKLALAGWLATKDQRTTTSQHRRDYL